MVDQIAESKATGINYLGGKFMAEQARTWYQRFLSPGPQLMMLGTKPASLTNPTLTFTGREEFELHSDLVIGPTYSIRDLITVPS